MRRVHPGRAQYTHLLDEDGSVVDDIIVWWVDEDRFDVMPNASNTSGVLAASGGHDVTAERAVVAVQGPEARATPVRRRARCGGGASFLRRAVRVAWRARAWLRVRATPARTGSSARCPPTSPPNSGRPSWRRGLRQRASAARDTLRLEAGLPLHGHELGPGITPLQAGLGWVVGWDKPAFTGRAALEEERATGPARRLRGFVGRRATAPPRWLRRFSTAPENVGTLTSGNFSPMRERGIGLGFVDADAQLLDGDAVTCAPTGAGARRRPRPSAAVAGPRRDPNKARTRPGRPGLCPKMEATTEYADRTGAPESPQHALEGTPEEQLSPETLRPTYRSGEATLESGRRTPAPKVEVAAVAARLSGPMTERGGHPTSSA